MKMSYTNVDIARLLRNVAVSYSIKDPDTYRFQIIAYNRAADSIESTPTQLHGLYSQGKPIHSVKGVGASIAEHIEELFERGSVKHFTQVMQEIPESLFPLLDIPNLGPKKAYKIIKTFQLTNPNTVISDVERVALKGEISKLEGFGKKSEDELLRSITEYRRGQSKSTRMPLPYAHQISEEIVSYMRKCPEVEAVETLGSLRRMRETIGDIDIAVASSTPERVIEYFVSYPLAARVIEKGPVSASITVGGGAQIDVMVQPPARFGALLQHFTGSKQHNVALRERASRQNLSLSERGIKVETDKKEVLHEFSSEKEFYNFLDLPYITPELRENRGEIEAAAENQLPKLVKLEDIKGDLHIHTNFNIEPSHDLGKNSMEEIVAACEEVGYQYVGLADHNPSVSNHTQIETEKIIQKRSKHIEQINSINNSVRVFNLLEVDILSDGSLALPDELLNLLDGAIVSLHSAFMMDRAKMTQRIISALSRPRVKIFGHPTGRLINSRVGADIEWDEVFKLCRARDIALEINSSPQRLDLTDTIVTEAVKNGVRLCINSDSHEKSSLQLMQYGVAVARRGWCETKNVVNTLPLRKFEQWLSG